MKVTLNWRRLLTGGEQVVDKKPSMPTREQFDVARDQAMKKFASQEKSVKRILRLARKKEPSLSVTEQYLAAKGGLTYGLTQRFYLSNKLWHDSVQYDIPNIAEIVMKFNDLAKECEAAGCEVYWNTGSYELCFTVARKALPSEVRRRIECMRKRQDYDALKKMDCELRKGTTFAEFTGDWGKYKVLRRNWGQYKRSLGSFVDAENNIVGLSDDQIAMLYLGESA